MKFDEAALIEMVEELDRRYATSTPLDHHCDVLDEMRYDLVWAVQAFQRTALMGKVRMEKGHCP